MFSALAAAADTPPLWIAPALFGVLFLVACSKCVRAARRPDTNSACETGLTFAYAVLVVVFFSAALLRAIDGELNRPGSPGQVVNFLLVGIVCPVLVITGFVYSIRGLAQMARRDRVEVKGRAAAILAMALFSAYIAVPILLIRSFGGSGYEGPNYGGYGLIKNVSGPQRPVELPEFDCKFAPRGPGWKSIDPKAVNPDAALVFASESVPTLMTVLICEDLGNEVDTEAMAELAEATFKARMDRYIEFEWKPRSLGNTPGLLGRTRAWLGGVELHYDTWIAATDGYVFQVLIFAQTGDVSQAEFARMAQDVRAGFSRLPSSGVGRGATYRSDVHGYEVALGREWRRDMTFGELSADFGAVGTDGGEFYVVPVDLDGVEVPPRALAEGLLRCARIEVGERGLSSPRPTVVNGLEALDFDYRGAWADGTRHVDRVRVVHSPERAWMVVASGPQGTSAETLADWIAAFSLSDATAVTAGDEVEAERQADVLRTVSVSLAAGGQVRAACSALERALEWRPARRDLHLWRLSLLCRAERYSELTTAVEQALSAIGTDDLELRSYRAFGRLCTGACEEGIEEYLGLYRDGFAGWHDLPTLATAMAETGRSDEGVRLLEGLRSRIPAGQGRVVYAQALLEVGRHDDAIEELETERERDPHAPGLEWALLDLRVRAGQYQAVRDMANAMIERGDDSVDAFVSKARAESGLRWLARAKETLQVGLERHPGDGTLLDELEHVNAALGRGSNRLVREVIEPVELPSGLPIAAGTGEGADGEDAVVLDRVYAFRYERGARLRRSELIVVKLLTQEGVTRYSSFRLPLDPLRERGHINYVRVRDADGELVAEGDLSDFFVLDGAEDGLASERKLINVAVPGLAVGRTVELLVTYRDVAPTTEAPFRSLVLSEIDPVERVVVSVVGDIDELAYSAPGGLRFRRTDDTLTWVASRPERHFVEPFSARPESFLPTIRIAAAGESWAKAGDAYLEELAERLTDESLRGVGAEGQSLGDHADPCDRAFAVARFVRDTLRYEAIEFGRRGLVPDDVARILSNRYGDCKDHALLLHALLKREGIESRLALARTSGPVDPTLPSLSQFDHMVVYCDSLGGRPHVFDCTSKYESVVGASPVGLAGERMLVLDSGCSRLVEAPSVEPAEVGEKRTVRIEVGGAATVTESVSFEGVYASAWRSLFASELRAGWRDRLQPMLTSSLPGAELLSVSRTDSEDETVLTIDVEYRLPRVVEGVGSEAVARAPGGWFVDLLTSFDTADRKTPFDLRCPIRLRGEVRVVVAEGWLAMAPDVPETSWTSGFGKFRREVAPLADGAELRYEWSHDGGTHAPSRYDEWVQDTTRVRAGQSLPLRMRSVAARPGARSGGD